MIGQPPGPGLMPWGLPTGQPGIVPRPEPNFIQSVTGESITTSDVIAPTIGRKVADRATAGTGYDATYDTSTYDSTATFYGYVGTVDTVSRAGSVYARSTAENYSAFVGDLITYALTRVVTAADMLTAAVDAATRLLAASRSPTETSVATDAVARQGALIRALADAFVIGDVARRAGAFARAVTDAVTNSDGVARAWGTGRAVAETLTPATDAVARLFAAARVAAETVAASDAVTYTIGRWRGITETLTSNDSVARAVAQARSVTEAVATSDAVVRVLTATRAVGDSLSSGDAITRVVGRLGAVVETLATTEVVAKSYGTARTAADALTPAVDAVGRAITVVRLAGEAVLATDVVRRSGNYGRGVLDSIAGLLSDFVASLHLGPYGYAVARDTAYSWAQISPAVAGGVYDTAHFDLATYGQIGESAATRIAVTDKPYATVTTMDEV